MNDTFVVLRSAQNNKCGRGCSCVVKQCSRLPMSLTLLFKVAALLLVFGGATAAGQSPSASATLYPPSEPLPEPESGPSAVAESSRDQLWACEGFAASAVEWETADAQLRLVLDGHVLVERGFSANY